MSKQLTAQKAYNLLYKPVSLLRKIDFFMAIGKNLLKLRNAKKLSQQSIADHLNIDRRTYAAWEEDKQDPKSNSVIRLAEFFGVEISDLYKSDTNINIKQSFKDSSINTAVLILTDKEAINRILDALKLNGESNIATS